ncbi:hypothetical protein HZA40_04595 [Candidatus Peregrinibacteria bacterium]|nr:hypothetical protein [Candidatus Peregrinibacteria bacterium]
MPKTVLFVIGVIFVFAASTQTTAKLPQKVSLNVSFSSQAPYSNWGMPYQEACEEAALMIVQTYLNNEELNPAAADKKILADGHPIIFPAAGRLLDNPHYTAPGPQYHMLVLIGYDENDFITNDPGTRYGQNYKYPYNIIINAIHDWHGNKENTTGGRKAMLVLTK